MARKTALEKARDDLAAATKRSDELMLDLQLAGEEAERLRKDRDDWRDARLPDREAEALSGCVRALDEMMEPPVNRSVDHYALARPSPRRVEYAGDSPVGRVLLSLAARYGLRIDEAEPPPDLVGPPVDRLIEDLHRTIEGWRARG